MKAKIYITLKNGVLDPQGKATQNALEHLGFSGIEEVKQGKLVEIKFANDNKAEIEESITQMCEKLIANTVIENYSFDIEEL